MNEIISINDAINEVRKGHLLIICDDENRENEGDLFCPAKFITPKIINFMTKYGRGLVCVAVEGSRLDALRIPLMVQENTSTFQTAFCVSVEAKGKTTTGISAYDRAATIKAIIDPKTKAEDLLKPGHVFPLRAKEGGVLRRPGQTEASIDLTRLAGLPHAGVICEVMKENGKMARMPDLRKFSRKHGIPIVTIADLIEYRLTNEILVKRLANPDLPTRLGKFKVIAYSSPIDDLTHLALVMGDLGDGNNVLVRVHSECLTGDTFGSMRCDCGPQLNKAMEMIAGEKRGVVVYLRQEGRGIGLVNKLKAYELQDKGLDTVEANHALGFAADQRDYGIGAQILYDLGIHKIRLLTNNPKKLYALKGFNIEIIEQIPLEIKPNPKNRKYLRTKKEKLGHTLQSV